jgi:DNA-binding LacI/PurR family transcriptional regulator
MKITIQEVAEKADVSPSTVSRVINEKGNISEETKVKVLEAAKELEYKPRKYTKSQEDDLESKYIGVVFSNQIANGIRQNAFYGQVMEGIEQILKKDNYNLLFKVINGEEKHDFDLINELINSRQVKGIILAGGRVDKKMIDRIRETDIPIVLIDNEIWTENIDSVITDNISGAMKVVDHLIELGHKKIGFIGGPLSHVSLNERYIGYKEALKSNGINKDKKFITFCEPQFEVSDAYEEMKKLLEKLDELPTAFFAANDLIAIGAIKALKEANYLVPDDISIVGFDDIEMSKHVTPTLSTVKVSKEDMGIKGAKRILELIEAIDTKPHKIVLSVEPVYRESIANLNNN